MKKQHVELSVEDKKSLEDLLSKGVQKVRVQKRALALQMLNKGMSYQEVKKHLNVSHISLSKWATLYKTKGLNFLLRKFIKLPTKETNLSSSAKFYLFCFLTIFRTCFLFIPFGTYFMNPHFTILNIILGIKSTLHLRNLNDQ